MQFGKVHGIALVILGVILLGFQTMLYMRPTPVVSGPNQSISDHKANPAVGIIGLIAGGAVLATVRRVDEPEAKNTVT